MATSTEEIRKLLEAGKLVIGYKEVEAGVAGGTVSRVIVAANAPASDADAMVDYGEMAGIEVERHTARNDQLGTICRKPFPVAFLAVKK